MTLLTKDEILGADDMTSVDVDVPGWGGTVRIKTMTGTERDSYEQMLIAQRGKNGDANIKNLRATLLAHTIVNEDGGLIFSTADVEALGKKSAKSLQKAFNVASELNALTEADVEELAGNSDAAQSGDSI